MSTMETPPPESTVPAGPPERRCPRCGSTLAPDQEWCLACGAAADTEVVEARGWRVPLYLGGGLAALAVLGVILAIVALSDRKEEQPGQAANPSPSAIAPVPTGSASPLQTSTPVPTVSAVPTETFTPVPTETATADPTEDPSTTGTFPGWTGADGDYTVIIDSSTTQADAEAFAEDAQAAGHTVGILDSSEYSSLNSGYWVVFSGNYATEDEAESALDGLKSDYSDAYIKRIST